MYKGYLNLLLLLSAFIASAQHYTTSFGQNRIQYKSFDWYYYSTNNFDIYYYPGGKEYAIEAIDFLEEEFRKLTDRLGYAPYNKTQIFIYNSIYDLQQSNVGKDGAVYTIGGRTDFVKLQVEVAYPGQAHRFKEDLLYELTSTLVNDMMYGGSLAEIFQNSYLLTLPSWFIDGAARYIAYGWSREMDDYVRDYMSRKKIKRLRKIDDESAAYIGQSIWNYIAVKYGPSNISNVLNLTRIIRKEENSIANTLGISFKTFMEDWKQYYLAQKEEVNTAYIPINDENRLQKIKPSSQLINSSVSFSKDADKVAYATVKNGRYHIYVTDIESGQTKKLTSGGYKLNGQAVDTQLPLLDWQDEFNLGAIVYKRGYLYLITYNIESGKKFQKPLNRFRQIESFSFNDNGRLAIVSGDIDGQNDLFLIAMNRNALRRITRDVYDDLDPVFVPGTAAIVFSSNRELDSVRIKNVPISKTDRNFNLFVYDLDTTTYEFARITNTLSEDRKPYVKNEFEIYYLSDQKGISNLFRYNLRDSTFLQVSNYDKSIVTYDLHFDPDRLVYSALSNGKEHVYFENMPDVLSSKFTPETPRKRRENALRVVARATEQELKKQQEEISIAVREPAEGDLVDTDNFTFEDDAETSEDEQWLDTDNYSFEEDGASTGYNTESFFSKYQNLEQKNERVGPKPYIPRFSFNNMITSFLWDPYRNFMMLVETELNDVLENYKVSAGALVKTSLDEGDLFIEFNYQKYWMDLSFRVDRKTYLLEDLDTDPDLQQKYKLSRWMGTAAVPITNSFRIEASPFVTQTSFTNLNYQSIIGLNTQQEMAENSSEEYVGARIGFVYDNTVEREYNLYQGFRALLEVTGHSHIENSSKNFGNIRLDARYYQKVHKEITWANRLFYGRHTGAAPKKYLLGGMDNWLFADFTEQGDGDPTAISNEVDNSDILFNEFVTNLRGLDYNTSYGENTLVFNSELRVPVFQYFSNGPIKSNFLRNFQLTSFFDIGTAWSGKPPFGEGNAITRKYGDPRNAFTAEIVEFQNPWLAGMGFGLRTVLLGYYLKVDAARPYIDGETGDYRFYVTLGLDF